MGKEKNSDNNNPSQRGWQPQKPLSYGYQPSKGKANLNPPKVGNSTQSKTK